MFADDFGGRVLPFDTEAAAAYGEIFAVRRKAGRASGTIDLMLAAIARVRGASVVTRNVARLRRRGRPDRKPLGRMITPPGRVVAA